MQELAPVVLFVALFLVLVVASLLTLVGSLLVIWRYQRGVEAAMHESGVAAAPVAAARAEAVGAVPSAASGEARSAATTSAVPTRTDADAVFARALRAPREAARSAAAFGLSFAVVLALAFLLAVPEARTAQRFLFTLWVDCWPIVIAAALAAPSFARAAALCSVAYFVPFVVAPLVVLMLPAAPADSIDAVLLEMRDTITPEWMLRQWFLYAALPTVALLLFLNPRLRAVSPLLLAFTTVVVSGCMAAWFAVFSVPGMKLFVQGAETTGWSVIWFLLAALLVTIAAGCALGWIALAGVRRAHLAKAISDRSLGFDSLWLFFAAYFATVFAVFGPLWLLTAVLAFAAGKLSLVLLRRHTRRTVPPLTPRGLTFLRVFALGAKSNALFDALAKHWRRIGSMQLITGPDVAHSVAQPHQLLDFISGRLASHFIADTRTLEARMAERDRDPDRDGWFRVNSFFCRADTWQAVLARLVGDGDVILMDLRSFSARNAGCVHELTHLVRFVPLGRCVFVVDASTEVADLRAVLHEAWRGLGEDAPNRSIDPGAVVLHRVDSPSAALPQLLRTLCAAA